VEKASALRRKKGVLNNFEEKGEKHFLSHSKEKDVVGEEWEKKPTRPKNSCLLCQAYLLNELIIRNLSGCEKRITERL